MKLLNLKKKLEINNKKFKENRIRKEFIAAKKNKREISEEFDLDKVKIIGITGSKGKSTVAYLLHCYLKSIGYKSVLYSSVMIDSPASHKNKNESNEVSISSEQDLCELINELEYYEADYLILEVNDSVINKGLVKEIPFDVRVLTNLNAKHNLEQFTEQEYINLKKSFFRNIDEKCKCIIGYQYYEKELFEELLELNNCDKYVFSTNYIVNVNGLNSEKFTCLLNNLKIDLDGLKMNFNLKGKSYYLESNLMMNYNSLNLLCVISILESLDLYSNTKFQELIRHVTIPGRSEIIKCNGRLIVIDPHLPNVIENLGNLKKEGLIKKIKVVIGSMGYGYKDWDERFKNERSSVQRNNTRKFAMSLLNKYADEVYLTENDNADESVTDICNELQSYLKKEIRSVIVNDREQAILQALQDSENGDVIFISGRGNRKVFCNSKNTMKLFKDKEVIEKNIKKLGW